MDSTDLEQSVNPITVDHILEYYNPDDGIIVAQDEQGVWGWVEEC